MSLDPHAAIAEAEKRAFQRQAHQMRLLVIALIALTFVAGFSAAGFFVSYSQARRNGAVAERVLHLTESVATLQAQIVTTTAIAQLGTNRILDCTTPEGKCLHDLQSQSGGAIGALNQAAAQGRQDLLRRLAELFQSLGVPQATVTRVLNEAEPSPLPYVAPPAPPTH